MSQLRRIPSIDLVLQRPALQRAVDAHGREVVVEAIRRHADSLRVSMKDHPDDAPPDVSAWIETRALGELEHRMRPSLRPVINATGVIIHTNLGRAPLAAEVLARVGPVGVGYSNLEFDLDLGTRGSRHLHAERLLCALTGAEAAAIVNNNAGATLLVLAALAAGREVIVSRGELVEIGGGFRVPEIMAQSGALLREVGTTNRTRVADYASAISDRTAAILRVHPSNFRVEGFTERPTLRDLGALAQRFSLPLIEDLGSGWLGVEPLPCLNDEPSVPESLRDGVDVAAFSGDKLLGGPQAGVLVGRRASIDRVRRHSLMRALRADKLTYAALEATLALWAAPQRWAEIPVYRMITTTADEIDRRARALIEALRSKNTIRCDVIDGASTIGGGSAPGSVLPSRLIVLEIDGLSAQALESRLRGSTPPIVARIQDDRVVIDLRTVAESEEDPLVRAICELSPVRT